MSGSLHPSTRHLVRQRVIDLKAAGKPAPVNTPEAELL